MQNPIDKMFFLGFLAGMWVGFGGIAGKSLGILFEFKELRSITQKGTAVAGGIPIDVRERWPTLPRMGIAFFFPFALHFILLFGGELFTGNTMILSVGLWNRTIPWYRTLLNLLIVWTANFLGCLTCAVLFSYETELFAEEPYLSFVRDLAYSKTKGHSWINIFLRGIPANTLVCMAVMLGFSARDSAGKIMALWFPVVLFVIPGFEHAVANMFFLTNGLLYGSPITVGWIFYNQSAALLGNLVGGAIIMGTAEHAMNHWNSPIPFEQGHAAGTLAAGDVESTRKAKEDRPSDEKQQMQNLVRSRTRSISGRPKNDTLGATTLRHSATFA